MLDLTVMNENVSCVSLRLPVCPCLCLVLYNSALCHNKHVTQPHMAVKWLAVCRSTVTVTKVSVGLKEWTGRWRWLLTRCVTPVHVCVSCRRCCLLTRASQSRWESESSTPRYAKTPCCAQVSWQLFIYRNIIPHKRFNNIYIIIPRN